MSKQDRQGVRTAADIERKYNFGKSFSEIMGVATDAQEMAQEASNAVGNLDSKLDHDEIFNRLTKNQTLQGLYRGDDGDLYINATYIKSGELLADLIKTGILKSLDGGVTIDLDKGVGNLARGTSAWLSTWDDDMGGWTKDIDEVIHEFVATELDKMQYDTIRDFAIRVDGSKYPDGAKLSLHKFRVSSGQPVATAWFEWGDGTASHIIANMAADSTWAFGEMAWRDPPMLLGVEYRTTERYNGSPVYVKRIDCGIAPNNSRTTVAHGITGIDRMVSLEGVATSDDFYQQLPLISSTGVPHLKVYASSTEILVVSFADTSMYSVEVVLKYTKK